MAQAQSPNTRQLPIILAAIGALFGAAFFYGVTMDIAAAVIFGAPVGLIVGIIGSRMVPRMMSRKTSKTAQLNGAAPVAPTIEEQVKPDFRMKTKS